MTRFVPDRIELHPRERIDDASEGLLRACYRRFAWLTLSLPRLLLLGIPSGGTLVAWLIAFRLRRFASLEQQKLELLAEWIERYRGERSDSTGNGASSDRPPAMLATAGRRLVHGTRLVMALATVTLGLFVITLRRDVAAAFASPLGSSIGLLPGLSLQDRLVVTFHAVATFMFAVLGGLLLARRAFAGRFVAWFNGHADAAGLPVVHWPRHWLHRPGWIVTIAAMAALAPPWASAMAVAGLLFLGYVRGTSDVLFVQFGETLRAGLERSHPGRFLPPRPDVVQRCGNESCGVLRPDGILYCPRCGADDTLPRRG